MSWGRPSPTSAYAPSRILRDTRDGRRAIRCLTLEFPRGTNLDAVATRCLVDSDSRVRVILGARRMKGSKELVSSQKEVSSARIDSKKQQ